MENCNSGSLNSYYGYYWGSVSFLLWGQKLWSSYPSIPSEAEHTKWMCVMPLAPWWAGMSSYDLVTSLITTMLMVNKCSCSENKCVGSTTKILFKGPCRWFCIFEPIFPKVQAAITLSSFQHAIKINLQSLGTQMRLISHHSEPQTMIIFCQSYLF